MPYFILEAALFALGLAICGLGKLPLSRRRIVRGSGAFMVGVILLIPLPVYLFVCQQSGVPAAGPPPPGFDAFRPLTTKLVHMTAAAIAAGCLLMASVLAVIASEVRDRNDKGPPRLDPDNHSDLA